MTVGAFSSAGLSLAAAAVWGGGDFSGGIAAKRASVFRVVAVAHAFGLLLMLVLTWAGGEHVPPPVALAWGAVTGITGAFGIAALYKGLSIGQMGIVAPVASVITAVLPVTYGFVIEGVPSRVQLLGFGIAVLSIWLITRAGEGGGSREGLGLAVLAGLMFGLFLTSGKEAGRYAVLWPLVSARVASTVVMFAIVLFSPRDPKPLRPALLPILISGAFDSFANALYIEATRFGRLDVAAVLSSLYPASTVILARVFLKERFSRTQIFGIVGALIAVALISAQ
jgi:drug/metabolite transporter (DMT)-like permease